MQDDFSKDAVSSCQQLSEVVELLKTIHRHVSELMFTKDVTGYAF